jgi:dipeptidyl aminopeptidase/acylaminoacyl peptidase
MWARTAIVGITLAVLAGCERPNHYLIHPRQPAPDVVTWQADFGRDQLWVHLEGARPPGPGPFPTVLVLPEEDHTAKDMRGIAWDLASRGYVAIAADYKRRTNGRYQRTYFAWRSTGDLELVLDAMRAYPEVDEDRLGVLGYSEGAVVGLLMAAHDPDRLKAVIAYSPITDFPRWYDAKRSGLSPTRVLIELARWQLRVDSGAPNHEEFERMLRLASPLPMAEYVKAPVLLVHGADDTLALPEESERMADALKAHGVTTKLVVVPGGERLFNFRQEPQAMAAWNQTLDWLDRYLRPAPHVTEQATR